MTPVRTITVHGIGALRCGVCGQKTGATVTGLNPTRCDVALPATCGTREACARHVVALVDSQIADQRARVRGLAPTPS